MVKVLLHRLLKVPLHDLRLTYISSKVRDGCCCHGDPPCIQYYVDVGVSCDTGLVCLQVSGTEFHLDRDMKTLHFYSVEDGDQVMVRWP